MNVAKFTKQGLSLNPVRFAVTWQGASFVAMIAIYPDGSLVIQSGGADIGQGISAKLRSVVLYQFGLTAENIPEVKVLPTNTAISSDGNQTGGSITSELCCKACMNVCEILNKRLEPFRSEGLSWKDSVAAALLAGVDLTAHGDSGTPTLQKFRYNTWGAALSRVEVDGLTGQSENLSTDIVFDCGQSLSPEVDVGQVSGGFVFALGWFTSEIVDYDKTNGAMKKDSTWSYKIPFSADIPREFNITLLPNSFNRSGVLSSRAVGEPPTLLAISVPLAIEDAINEIRKECLGSSFTPFAVTSTPLTVDKVANACNIPVPAYTLS